MLSRAHHFLLAPGGPGRSFVRRSLAAEMIERSARADEPDDLLTGLLWQTVTLFLEGDRRAERHLAEVKDALAGPARPAVADAVGAIDVLLAIRAGELARAEARARDGLDRGGPEAAAVYLRQIAAIRWYQGRRVAVGGRDLAGLPRSDTWLVTVYDLIEAACRREDADTAARAYELLSPYANLPVIAGSAVACLGSAQHPLGVAALTVGRLDRAVRHFRAAVDGNLALAHWPALALSRFRLAQALTRRGSGGDLRLAGEVLATARREAGALGLPAPDYAGERPGRPEIAGCARVGERWRIGYGRRSVLLPDSVGLVHLAVLLAAPGRRVPAVELAAGLRALRAGGPSLDPERARLAVSKAIRRAITAVARLEPGIGAHLEESVVTGAQCGYLPA